MRLKFYFMLVGNESKWPLKQWIINQLAISTRLINKIFTIMDLRYFQEYLNIFAYNAKGLSMDETVQCEISLNKLLSDEKLEKILFWGRVFGTKSDYFISLGYNGDCLKNRKMYFSKNLTNWSILPPLDEKYKEATLLCSSPLIGDLSCTSLVKLHPSFTSNDNNDIIEENTDEIMLPEGSRLAWIVNFITNECAIIPRGSLYKQTDGRVTENPLFQGIDPLQVREWKNYQLWREPRNVLKNNLLKRKDFNHAIDFLDTIDDILPNVKAFALDFEKGERFIFIKSLMWLGMTFFYDQYTKNHGFLYFGHGFQNMDILFMIDFDDKN